MHSETYKPNERIVDRAVWVWIQLLNPECNSLIKDFPVSVHSVMRNNAPEAFDRFGVELKKALMEPNETGHYVYCLDVDYTPATELKNAASKSGLCVEFPQKTAMWIHDNYLSIRYGRGEEAIYHYPLSDDRWFITTLHGEDIIKIIALIEDGVIDLKLEALKFDFD